MHDDRARTTMFEAIRGGVPESESAKQFLDVVKENFVESEKAKTENLMTKLTNMNYDGNMVMCVSTK